MPTYDVGDHPLLSDEATALDREVFDASARVAELELGLNDTRFHGQNEEDAKLAIVLRINRNVARDQDVEAADKFVKRERRGDQETEYEERAEVRAKANQPAATPEEEIAARLVGAFHHAVLPTQR